MDMKDALMVKCSRCSIRGRQSGTITGNVINRN